MFVDAPGRVELPVGLLPQAQSNASERPRELRRVRMVVAATPRAFFLETRSSELLLSLLLVLGLSNLALGFGLSLRRFVLRLELVVLLGQVVDLHLAVR